MNRVITRGKEIAKKYPHLLEQVMDLIEMCQDEIADEGSYEGEIELCLQSMDELVEDESSLMKEINDTTPDEIFWGSCNS